MERRFMAGLNIDTATLHLYKNSFESGSAGEESHMCGEGRRHLTDTTRMTCAGAVSLLHLETRGLGMERVVSSTPSPAKTHKHSLQRPLRGTTRNHSPAAGRSLRLGFSGVGWLRSLGPIVP